MADYPRESSEYQRFTITNAGTPVTSGITTALLPMPLGTQPRPTDWIDALTLDDGTTAVHIGGLDPGNYTLWAKITTTNPLETPVRKVGVITIT